MLAADEARHLEIKAELERKIFAKVDDIKEDPIEFEAQRDDEDGSEKMAVKDTEKNRATLLRKARKITWWKKGPQHGFLHPYSPRRSKENYSPKSDELNQVAYETWLEPLPVDVLAEITETYHPTTVREAKGGGKKDKEKGKAVKAKKAGAASEK